MGNGKSLNKGKNLAIILSLATSLSGLYTAPVWASQSTDKTGKVHVETTLDSTAEEYSISLSLPIRGNSKHLDIGYKSITELDPLEDENDRSIFTLSFSSDEFKFMTNSNDVDNSRLYDNSFEAKLKFQLNERTGIYGGFSEDKNSPLEERTISFFGAEREFRLSGKSILLRGGLFKLNRDFDEISKLLTGNEDSENLSLELGLIFCGINMCGGFNSNDSEERIGVARSGKKYSFDVLSVKHKVPSTGEDNSSFSRVIFTYGGGKNKSTEEIESDIIGFTGIYPSHPRYNLQGVTGDRYPQEAFLPQFRGEMKSPAKMDGKIIFRHARMEDPNNDIEATTSDLVFFPGKFLKSYRKLDGFYFGLAKDTVIIGDDEINADGYSIGNTWKGKKKNSWAFHLGGRFTQDKEGDIYSVNGFFSKQF